MENLAGNSCGKILWENLVGKSCGKILWENLAGESCGKILWEILAGNSCGKILQEILVGNAVGNLVRNLLGNLAEKVLMVCNGVTGPKWQKTTNIGNFWHLGEFLSPLQPLKHYQTISIL